MFPKDLSSFFLTSSIIFFLLSLFSNLIKKSVSFPNFLTETSPKSICLKLSLSEVTLILVSIDLNSIKVPPLKSIPKFNPLKTNNNSETKIRKLDKMLNLL